MGRSKFRHRRREFCGLGVFLLTTAGCLNGSIEADHPQLQVENWANKSVEVEVTLRNETGEVVFADQITLPSIESVDTGWQKEYFDIVENGNEYQIQVDVIAGAHVGTTRKKTLGIGESTGVIVEIEKDGVDIRLG